MVGWPPLGSLSERVRLPREIIWWDGRVVEGACLEYMCAERYPGFESQSHRQNEGAHSIQYLYTNYAFAVVLLFILIL